VAKAGFALAAEVRHAPALLRRLTDAWLALLFVAMIAAYLLGQR
jgi:hypothetical protein